MNKRSLQNVSLLIWNDDATAARSWEARARDDGFPCVRSVTARDVREVVKQYVDLKPDVLVVDLMFGEDNPLGRAIAAAVQERDPLATIVVLTRKPEQAYAPDGYMRWRGYAGVYHCDVITVDGQFRDVVVAESLVFKHLLQPEFVLARECGWRLDQYDRWGEYEGLVDALKAAIYRLPTAGSSDSWHPVLCKAVASALSARGWSSLADRYQVAVDLFQSSDPFYMAGSNSRRHLSHNVQVCLLGLAILLADGPVRQSAINDVGTLLDAMLIWCCVGTVHDTAYLSENLEIISGKLAKLASGFSRYVGGMAPEAWKWPRTHHAEVGSKIWTDSFEAPAEERAAASRVARAIAGHDGKRRTSPALLSEWCEFLAVVSDELQDWERTRAGAEPGHGNQELEQWRDVPWRLMEPLRFDVSRDSDSGFTWIALEFLVVDHGHLIAEVEGIPSVEIVGRRFDEMLASVKRATKSEEKLGIRLDAHFMTRDTISIVKKLQLSTR